LYHSLCSLVVRQRCVSCHSCYNAPCQTKFEAFEGVDRGGSKIEVYNAMRLRSIEPTRLFVDAQSTQEWRAKDFFSLTQGKESNATHNDSIMAHLLHQKKLKPEIIGEYSPESDTLECPKDKSELEAFIEKKPYHAMPYGFPALSENEHTTLMAWLTQGANGPTPQEQQKLTSPSPNAINAIREWERFFNTPDTSRISILSRVIKRQIFLS